MSYAGPSVDFSLEAPIMFSSTAACNVCGGRRRAIRPERAAIPCKGRPVRMSGIEVRSKPVIVMNDIAHAFVLSISCFMQRSESATFRCGHPGTFMNTSVQTRSCCKEDNSEKVQAFWNDWQSRHETLPGFSLPPRPLAVIYFLITAYGKVGIFSREKSVHPHW